MPLAKNEQIWYITPIMLRSFIHNPLRRGIVGALLFGSVPYMFAAYNNGVMLEGVTGNVLFLICACGVFALIGFGIFHGGARRAKKNGFHQPDWVDHDMELHDFINQEGAFAQMRDQWDPNYMRDKY